MKFHPQTFALISLSEKENLFAQQSTISISITVTLGEWTPSFSQRVAAGGIVRSRDQR